MGFIHRTWKIHTTDGIFTLQHVNPIFSPTVMEDVEAVLGYLRGKGCTVIEVVRTRDGALFVPDENCFWRLFTYIPGTVYEIVPTAQVAREAGALLGRYHRLLNDGFPYEFKHTRPMKKNIPLLYELFRKAIEGNANVEIAELIPTIRRMPALDLPPHLRKTVNHGDPKISNFIFSEVSTPHAITMVDFDDCGRSYNPVLELSSAFRSWSWQKGEGRDQFNLVQFEAGLRGYDEGSEHFLTAEERGFIPQALELNLLQLASRFIRDFFEDRYFAWDSTRYPSRQAQNLARAKEHLALYHDIVAKREAILGIIHGVPRP